MKIELEEVIKIVKVVSTKKNLEITAASKMGDDLDFSSIDIAELLFEIEQTYQIVIDQEIVEQKAKLIAKDLKSLVLGDFLKILNESIKA